MIDYLSQTTKDFYVDTAQHIVYAIFVCALITFFPSFAHAEQIDSFVSDIVVAKDTTLTVQETIVYVFTEQKHGIFRCLPTKHDDPASSLWKERYIEVTFTGVRMDDGSVPYDVTKKRDEVCVKIGDPDNTITGAHTYEISYIVSGAISYETYGGADLYWNVTGHDWEVPILSVTAHVSSPDPILLPERACYRGLLGQSNSCQISASADGVVTFSGTLLKPREGLTLAQALNRAQIPTDIRERYKTVLIGVVLVVLLLLAFLYGLYRYKTHFKTGRTIIPQYEPYPGVKPMYMGALFDGKLDPRDISAGIVYLAEQGYIKIKKTEKKVLFFFEVDDYEITVTKKIDAAVGQFEKSIITLLFKSIKDLESALPVGSVTSLSTVMKSREANSRHVMKLQKSIERDLVETGFFEERNLIRKLKTPSGFMFGLGLIFLFLPFTSFPLYGIILILLSIGFGLSFRRRTIQGYEALDHLKGFKEFLKVSEKERYIFHNAPQKNAEQFMEYLPYAIAFGVEKEWAKTFEGITIQNPSWYEGGGSAHTFNTVSLTQSLSSFSSSLASSTSSGGSASSGGGSAGGGSGGGGGGSW